MSNPIQKRPGKKDEISEKLRKWAEDPTLGEEPCNSKPIWFEEEIFPLHGRSPAKKKEKRIEREDEETQDERTSPWAFWRCGMIGIVPMDMKRNIPTAFALLVR